MCHGRASRCAIAVLLGLTMLFASGLRRLLLIACARAWACCSSLSVCEADHGCCLTRLTAPVQIPKSEEKARKKEITVQ